MDWWCSNKNLCEHWYTQLRALLSTTAAGDDVQSVRGEEEEEGEEVVMEEWQFNALTQLKEVVDYKVQPPVPCRNYQSFIFF